MIRIAENFAPATLGRLLDAIGGNSFLSLFRSHACQAFRIELVGTGDRLDILQAFSALAWCEAFALVCLSRVCAGVFTFITGLGEVDACGDAFAGASPQHESYLGFHYSHGAAAGVPAVRDWVGGRRFQHGCGSGVGFVGAVEEDVEGGAAAAALADLAVAYANRWGRGCYL